MKDIILYTVHINKNLDLSIENLTRNLKSAESATHPPTTLQRGTPPAYADAGVYGQSTASSPDFAVC